ncbi:MAG: dTDP-4-dehydrorhamnose 3,5-epimerase family protein, partial [Desulfobacterales bacterium]
MKVIRTPLAGILKIEPRVFSDSRGYFLESYQRVRFVGAGIEVNFVQDNLSFSRKNTLRGLHYQNPR